MITNLKSKVWVASLVALASNVTLAENIRLDYRYTVAETGERVSRTANVAFDANVASVSDRGIEKSLFAIALGNALKISLTAFNEACHFVPEPGPTPIPRPIPAPRPILPHHPAGVPGPIFPKPPVPELPADCVERRVRAADELLVTIDKLSRRLGGDRSLQDPKLYETLDLGRKLAKNMKEAKDRPVFSILESDIKVLSLRGGVAAAAGLNVTSGGAQDFGFVRKTIEDGNVPHQDNLTMEGFLSELDLSLENRACDELLCVQPAVKVSPDSGKLFLQIGMSSNVDRASFQRKPLNLAVVLDVSGSMSATDNTEKTRLEWAKEALVRTINELNENDVLSIVLFDTQSEVLVPAAPVRDRAELIALVEGLKTKGSTNLEAGLVDGYEEVSRNIGRLEGYEHRVILISDAGLNTGVTDQAALLRTITDFAGDEIGLTAIGLGLNFNQELIHGITQSRGGNYLFVHSGKDMFRTFEAFDYLVTPVAHGFKVALEVEGANAKVVNSYGVPTTKGEPVRELIDIQSLFFSEAGGAIVLELDLVD